MPEEKPVLPPEARKAVHAARDAAYEIEVARQVQAVHAAEETARIAAELAAEKFEEKSLDQDTLRRIVREQMQHVLTQGTKEEREAIVARIPFVCEDIRKLNIKFDKLIDLLTYYPLIQKTVFTAGSMILVGAMGAILALIYK